jgi:hypothetical protein
VIQYLSFRCFEMRFQMILDLRRLQSNWYQLGRTNHHK